MSIMTEELARGQSTQDGHEILHVEDIEDNNDNAESTNQIENENRENLIKCFNLIIASSGKLKIVVHFR